MGWPVAAAFQCAFVKSGGFQHGGGDGDVMRFTAMGSLRQGQLTLAVAERVGCTAFDQWQRLDRLDGGTRINRFINIAGREDGAAVSIEYRYRAAMTAFHAAAACDFDKDGIGHSLSNFR